MSMPAIDPALRKALIAHLRFCRDIGVTDLYRRAVDPALLAQLQPVPGWEELSDPIAKGAASPASTQPPMGDHGEAAADPSAMPQDDSAKVSAERFSKQVSQENDPIPPRKRISAPPAVLTEIRPIDKAAALRLIQEDIGDCTRCALHKGRNKLVFADGSPDARLMFVGEGPGADEDAQGLPFVGRAGQLLNNMITAMGLKREEVYIANVVKCRPPGNRTPEPDEANTCSPFLFRQIDVVRPEVIVALGATAATYLLGQRQPLAGLRGRVHSFRGSKLIVTYHPAFLLRDPRQKKEAWADLQIAMRELGLTAPSRG